ncbi:HAD family phosphatase [Aquimarina sp. 2201CG5-10]|uniref:HAD family hydrolase n=1 Tax=Aquimarina callyspongiae TaxID=3098150 RepID=UPI002AB53D40|nr:HAD family phosphatase [Aquimarina sp. 2201CG5-10]MDY8138282.1 HAD family phosphatase [Aquimarina sp. 2201CG5-10]
MIKTIIFDFGDVFINLDKPATQNELLKLGDINFDNELQEINDTYETGDISTQIFLDHYNKLLPKASEKQLIDAWNAILLDFPESRLNFIKQLALEKKYKLILLSNTNELHIDWIKNNVSFYEVFKSCFDSFYLSHQIHLRKPNINIFEFVISQHNLIPSETLFIDDTKANTNTAAGLGIHVWNNNPKKEDITDLFTIKSVLF